MPDRQPTDDSDDPDDPDDPGDGRTDDRDGNATTEDRTELVRRLYDRIPLHDEYGIRVERVTGETATVTMTADDALVGNPEVPAVHGGVISTLADLAGAAVCIGHVGTYAPTIDLRVDYLAHASPGELRCRAELVRLGGSIGVAETTVRDADGRCAIGRGVYKLSR